MSVLQTWAEELTIMMQSVLISNIRGADGSRKHHEGKPLIRYYRRCLLISAFDKRALLDPYEQGGGSFTGPLVDMTLEEARLGFIKSLDELPYHYIVHFMHAVEIMGYKHSDESVKEFWKETYFMLVENLHLYPESEEQLNLRLSDNPIEWAKRDVEQNRD